MALTMKICDQCHGNGFLRPWAKDGWTIHQCHTCKSQGEIDLDLPLFGPPQPRIWVRE